MAPHAPVLRFGLQFPPASVVEQVTERLDAGLDGIVFNLPASPEPETVALAGSTLAALGA